MSSSESEIDERDDSFVEICEVGFSYLGSVSLDEDKNVIHLTLYEKDDSRLVRDLPDGYEFEESFYDELRIPQLTEVQYLTPYLSVLKLSLEDQGFDMDVVNSYSLQLDDGHVFEFEAY